MPPVPAGSAPPGPAGSAPSGSRTGEDQLAYVAAARARAHLLYEGAIVPHRSCGVALAETFGLPTGSYQALRRGGITGEGSCGSIAAGVLVLGEILGDPSPTGPVTPELREAVTRYRGLLAARVDRPADLSCNLRTAALGPFTGLERHGYCTSLTATVAEIIAAVLWDLGRAPALAPVPPDSESP